MFTNGSKIDPATWMLGEKRTVKSDVSGPHILVYFPEKTERFLPPASWGMTEYLVANPGDAVAYTMLDDGTPDLLDKYVIDRLVFNSTYEKVI